MSIRAFGYLVFVLFHTGAICQMVHLPDSILRGAHEVALSDETVFEVSSKEKSILSRKYRALILNRNASRYNKISLGYDDFRKITSAEVRVTSGDGREIETYRLRDFEDYGFDGGDLISDARFKHLEIPKHSLPYVVEVEYSVVYKGSLFYPAWYPQFEKEGVVQSSFEVICHSDAGFRHESVGIEPEILSTNHLRWQVRNLTAFSNQKYSYDLEDYAPYVLTAANEFQMDGIEGDLSTWEGLGQWIGKLNHGTNDLTSEQVADLLKRVPEGATDLDKVRIAYEYMQESTRYVSIQLGLGGWRPFPASFVHEKKYGDCKALSNYTRNLLEKLDVRSYYTLIRAGAFVPPLHPNFPQSSFNHAILTVPMDQDTVWLECTSQTNPFGYLGTFTSGRKALMITDDGAEVINTRSYSPSDNRQVTITKIEVADDGSGVINSKRQYTGLEIGNDGFSQAANQGKSEQEKWFVDEHDWGNLQLVDLQLSDVSQDAVPVGMMEVEAKIANISRKSANRIFFNPFVFTNLNDMKFKSRNRTVPIEIRYGFSQYDSIQVDFPAGYYPESDFSPVTISTNFGSYDMRLERGEDGYLFIRKMILNPGKYEADECELFKEFITKIHKADRKRLVLVDKT